MHHKLQMDLTAKTALAVEDDSVREVSSERGTFSGEKLTNYDGHSVGIDTCRELSDSEVEVMKNIECKTEDQKEDLDCEATQREDECSFLNMNALMAAESLEYKKVIYPQSDCVDTAVTHYSDCEDNNNTAIAYSDAEDGDPCSFIIGDYKSCRKQKPTSARRASFYVDKEMQNMHAYYTDFSNNAVAKLIANGMMSND